MLEALFSLALAADIEGEEDDVGDQLEANEEIATSFFVLWREGPLDELFCGEQWRKWEEGDLELARGDMSPHFLERKTISPGREQRSSAECCRKSISALLRIKSEPERTRRAGGEEGVVVLSLVEAFLPPPPPVLLLLLLLLLPLLLMRDEAEPVFLCLVVGVRWQVPDLPEAEELDTLILGVVGRGDVAFSEMLLSLGDLGGMGVLIAAIPGWEWLRGSELLKRWCSLGMWSGSRVASEESIGVVRDSSPVTQLRDCERLLLLLRL